MADNLEVMSMINRWLLDFVCYSAWQEFITQGRIDISASRDFIQGILGKCSNASKTTLHSSKIRLIVLLCKLSDGQEYDTQYNDNQEDQKTVLEYALVAFNKLLSSLQLSDGKKKSSERIVDLISLQAVFVCCRDNNFDLAKAVYKRLWKNVKCSSHKAEIDAVLLSKDVENKILRKHSYESLLENVQTFLQPIVDSFKTPFIISMAKQVLENKKKYFPSSESDEDHNVNSPRTQLMSKKRKTDTNIETRDEYFSSLGLVNSAAGGETAAKKRRINSAAVDLAIDVTRYQTVVIEPDYLKPEGNPINKVIQGLENKLEDIRKCMRPSEQHGPGGVSNGGDQMPSPEKRKCPPKITKLVLNEFGDAETTPESKLCKLGQGPRVDRNLAPPRSPSNVSVTSTSSIRLKQPWMAAEVQSLIKGVEQFGIGQWAVIREKFDLQSRTNVQLKDKWRNLILNNEVDISQFSKSGYDKKPFTAKEEACLWDGVKKFGRQWQVIKEQYPDLRDRSIAALLAKYNTMNRKRWHNHSVDEK
ncbi:telomeric repeat-binding factor 2 [Lingula anatina]|uniref:Telomeric repeat-binding factor 2 n=1 Tax=Lingula anatina TaxID=7574 RepID=A0A1S3KCB3_LINAN|nr:telomeric repeat-binding factor 2 [Lingula anatina]|eukprot:XP_013420132.1 telomeric repeat-binding factor 2 [Lingula anatina]